MTGTKPDVLAVSACLAGRPCRWDGRSRADERVIERIGEWEAAGGTVVLVCPEEAGGLGTPRPPSELRDGDGAAVLAGRARVVRVCDGADMTSAFVAGATREAGRAIGASRAILKARSPSCGYGATSIDGEVRGGDGVFAALLRSRGVALETEEA